MKGVFLAAALFAAGSLPGVAWAEGVPGSASASGAVPAVSDAAKADAYEAAQIYYSEASARSEVKAAIATLITAFKSEPAFIEAEEQLPGITAYIIAAIEPGVTEELVQSLPDLWTQLANVMTSRMNEAELAEYKAYLLSPTARRMREVMLAKADYGDILQEVRGTGDFQGEVTSNTILKTQMQAASKAAAEISPEDAKVVMDFAGRPVFIKVANMLPELSRVTSNWANQKMAFEGEIDGRVDFALSEFVNAAQEGREPLSPELLAAMPLPEQKQ
jgi:hypothetical protein